MLPFLPFSIAELKNDGLVNSHNYLTNGAWNAETSIVFHFFEIETRFCDSKTKLK